MIVTLADLADLADPAPPPGPAAVFPEWARDGVLHLPGLIPEDVVDAYCARFVLDAYARARDVRLPTNGPTVRYLIELGQGYGIGTPYMRVPELRDVGLHRDLAVVLEAVVGERAGMHLNLTGWKSTQRAWHQDQYLNPPCVGMGYVAAWIALDDVDPDAGPFEYVPRSHLWPSVAQGAMLDALGEDGSDPDWPWRSEAILGPLFDREIAERGATVIQHLPRKGDVLLWHPNLCHRGSVPVDPSLARRALIVHYSAVSRRCDMRGRERRWLSDAADGWYFDL